MEPPLAVAQIYRWFLPFAGWGCNLFIAPSETAAWSLLPGATILAAPVIAVSLLAPEYQQSFAALLVGFALSEAWRAPAAIMIRDVSPPNLGSTGSAIHLCIRNLLGGAGPLGEAAPSMCVMMIF